MKKRVFVIISLCLAASLLSACGSPTAVFETSEKASLNTVTVEKDKNYTYDTFCFSLDCVRSASPAPKDRPKGKWAEIRLNIVAGTFDTEVLDRFVKEENILLCGAPARSYDIKAEMDIESMNALSYYLVVYYDVPEKFDINQAVVTCCADVREGRWV